jgi:hypothetical protein
VKLITPENYNWIDRLMVSMNGFLNRLYSKAKVPAVLLLSPLILAMGLTSVLFHIVDLFLARAVQRSGRLQTRPPLNAEYLFYLFMTPQNCYAFVGDLEERYRLICRKFGRRRADFWYWTQTAMSLGPVVWAWAKKIVLKPVLGIAGWAVAKGLVGHDGWLATVVELWKRIRS